jgi:hypothetical protein
VNATASGLLRPGLLEGRALMLAHASEGGLVRAVRETCEGLGATVQELSLVVGADEEIEVAGEPDVLVVDLTDGASRGLVRCMEEAWSVTRAVAASAFLPGEDGTPRRGRAIYVTPAPDAGEHADAARAAVENMVRTLSIEWARFAVTTVAIAPGVATAPQDMATLIAYLASDAGEYFSGCQLDLRGA